MIYHLLTALAGVLALASLYLLCSFIELLVYPPGEPFVRTDRPEPIRRTAKRAALEGFSLAFTVGGLYYLITYLF